MGRALAWQWNCQKREGRKRGFDGVLVDRWRTADSAAPHLVHHPPQRFERLTGQRVARLDLDGFLKAAHGLAIHLLAEIRTSQVVARKMARLVAPRFDCLLEPGNRLIELAKFDHIGANV